MSPKPSLDHLILLIPRSYLTALPKTWSGFTPYPGGVHADGLTQNVLIPLRSGTYLELIAFITDDESARKQHWWGAKKPGWIDWCLTTLGEESAPDTAVPEKEAEDALRDGRTEAVGRRRLPLVYADSVAGGRDRPDGRRVQWNVTFPSAKLARGSVPFWCHDLTPRPLRVPDSAEAVKHGNGAVGVAEVRLVAWEEDILGYATAFAKLVGSDVKPLTDGGLEGDRVVEVGHPKVDGLPLSRIVVGKPRDDLERDRLSQEDDEATLVEVVLFVEGSLVEPIDEEIDGQKLRIGFRKI